MRFRLFTATFVARDQAGTSHTIEMWTEFLNGGKQDQADTTEIRKCFRTTIDGRSCHVSRLDKGRYRVEMGVEVEPLHLFSAGADAV